MVAGQDDDAPGQGRPVEELGQAGHVAGLPRRVERLPSLLEGVVHGVQHDGDDRRALGPEATARARRRGRLRLRPDTRRVHEHCATGRPEGVRAERGPLARRPVPARSPARNKLVRLYVVSVGRAARTASRAAVRRADDLGPSTRRSVSRSARSPATAPDMPSTTTSRTRFRLAERRDDRDGSSVSTPSSVRRCAPGRPPAAWRRPCRWRRAAPASLAAASPSTCCDPRVGVPGADLRQRSVHPGELARVAGEPSGRRVHRRLRPGVEPAP